MKFADTVFQNRMILIHFSSLCDLSIFILRLSPDFKIKQIFLVKSTNYICSLHFLTGLTAVSSAEILDIMFHDFPEKYEEFRQYVRDKQAREMSFKQKGTIIYLSPPPNMRANKFVGTLSSNINNLIYFLTC